MKRLSLSFLVCAAFAGTACERHSASTLPAHGGGQADSHAAPAAHSAPTPTPAASPAPSPEKAKDAPAAKFFEQQPK